MGGRSVWAAAAVALLAAISLFGAAGGALATSSDPAIPDFSTDSAVASYLTAQGLDPADFVIQRGARNYAGPNCPGAGWNCTTAAMVVQIAPAGGENRFECGDPALLSPDLLVYPNSQTNNECVVVQHGQKDTDNHARCICHIQTESAVAPPQKCDITQGADGGGHNHAIVRMTIHQKGPPNQTASQETDVRQLNDAGYDNHAEIYVATDQFTSATGFGPIDQDLKADQAVVVEQDTEEGGDNFAAATTSLFERAHASGTAIMQKLNATDTRPDSRGQSFVDIDQRTDVGQNNSSLRQDHDLTATAKSTTGPVQQTEGSPSGGLVGEVSQQSAESDDDVIFSTSQESAGTSTSYATQNEIQRATASVEALENANSFQKQYAPQDCCSNQFGDEKSKVDIDQRSTQHANGETVLASGLVILQENEGALQVTDLHGHFFTTGDGTVFHRAVQDDGSLTRRCPPEGVSSSGLSPSAQRSPACDLHTILVNGQTVTCDEDEEVFNPVTGRCEPLPPPPTATPTPTPTPTLDPGPR